jgi:hypothetical protein
LNTEDTKVFTTDVEVSIRLSKVFRSVQVFDDAGGDFLFSDDNKGGYETEPEFDNDVEMAGTPDAATCLFEMEFDLLQ